MRFLAAGCLVWTTVMLACAPYLGPQIRIVPHRVAPELDAGDVRLWHDVVSFHLSTIRDADRLEDVCCAPRHSASTRVDLSLPFVVACGTPGTHSAEEDTPAAADYRRAAALCKALHALTSPEDPAYDPAADAAWQALSTELAERALRASRLPTRAETTVIAYHALRGAGVLTRAAALADETAPRVSPDDPPPTALTTLDDDWHAPTALIQAGETRCSAVFRIWDDRLTLGTLGDRSLRACLDAHLALTDRQGAAFDPGYAAEVKRLARFVTRHVARAPHGTIERRELSRKMYDWVEDRGLASRMELQIVSPRSQAD